MAQLRGLVGASGFLKTKQTNSLHYLHSHICFMCFMLGVKLSNHPIFWVIYRSIFAECILASHIQEQMAPGFRYLNEESRWVGAFQLPVQILENLLTIWGCPYSPSSTICTNGKKEQNSGRDVSLHAQMELWIDIVWYCSCTKLRLSKDVLLPMDRLSKGVLLPINHVQLWIANLIWNLLCPGTLCQTILSHSYLGATDRNRLATLVSKVQHGCHGKWQEETALHVTLFREKKHCIRHAHSAHTLFIMCCRLFCSASCGITLVLPYPNCSINLSQVTISIQRSALGLKHQHLQEAVVPKQAH